MTPDQQASVIPGMTKQAEEVLRMIIREEMHELEGRIRSIIEDSFDDPSCPRPCSHVAELKKTVYGNGASGLKTAVTTHAQQIENLVWWNRATIAASLAAVGTVLVQAFR